jgi:ABC-2 type transport system ATP-binding protein
MINALYLDGVIKKFKGFTLGPLEMILEPGRVLGLVGPNGAGKTTTINILGGLIRHDTGSIKIFGRDLNLNDPKWKFDIGYVGDTHAFYEYWSGERNLKFRSEFYPAWDNEWMRELAGRFPLDLKKRANRLSRGNRAKLALIGALSHRPKLLLLDEPTSGLDPIVRAEFLETLWEIMEQGDSSVFYSTHILSDIAKIADELAFLADGKFVRREMKDDLVNRFKKISFRFTGPLPEIHNSHNLVSEGDSHMLVSSDQEVTLKQLHEMNADEIQVTQPGIDEITIHILKGLK